MFQGIFRLTRSIYAIRLKPGRVSLVVNCAIVKCVCVCAQGNSRYNFVKTEKPARKLDILQLLFYNRHSLVQMRRSRRLISFPLQKGFFFFFFFFFFFVIIIIIIIWLCFCFLFFVIIILWRIIKTTNASKLKILHLLIFCSIWHAVRRNRFFPAYGNATGTT